MPLGSALKTKIEIDVTRAQGLNSSGRILFYPPRVDVGTTLLSPEPAIAEIKDGLGSIELVRLPSGMYRAVEHIDGRAGYSFRFELPASSPDTMQYRQLVKADPVATTSILNDIKLDLGLSADYDAFDPTVIRHINSAFSRLGQLGIGPPQGYKIANDQNTWSEILADDRFEDAKAYIFLKVKMLFDPPPTSFAIAAIQDQIREYEWTLNVKREEEEWTEPMV
jgi:hypothetical protein